MSATVEPLSASWLRHALYRDAPTALTPYWGQIQRVDGLVPAMREPFERGKRQKAYFRPDEIKDADFDELTHVLVEKAVFGDSETNQTYKMPDYGLQYVEPGQIDLVEKYLTADGKRAAEIVLDDQRIMRGGRRHKETQRTVLHGKECFRANFELPHTDGGDVVLARYSGPRTIVYKDGFSPKKPEQSGSIKVEHGHVWTHKSSNILGVDFHSEFPFVASRKPSWHAKGPANGQPGLYNVMDLI